MIRAIGGHLRVAAGERDDSQDGLARSGADGPGRARHCTGTARAARPCRP
jgi:hypothetical protein